MGICKCFRCTHLKITAIFSKRKTMTSTRSADLKLKNRLSSLKLLTNLDVKRFLIQFKCERLSKQKSVNRTCDEVVLLQKKVVDGSTTKYTCSESLTRQDPIHWGEYPEVEKKSPTKA